MPITQGNITVGLEDGFLTVGAYGAAEGACTDLGATDGGAEISLPREYYEKMCDQALGPLDIIKISEKCILKVKLAESTLANLALAMDYPSSAVAAGVLSVGGNAATQYLTIYLNVKGVSGGTKKYHFLKAVCISAASHSPKRSEKTVIECEFHMIQDTTKTANQQLFTITESASDTTAPTIAMTTPAAGGTVTKDAKGTVLLTITETNLMNEGTIVYGDSDGGTIAIYNVTTNTAVTLVAGTIVYDASAKTVTFTPTANWTASDKHMVVVTTGLADNAGNHLASTFIGHFSVTA